MLNFVSANFLTQMTDKPTKNNNILNLTLTTNQDLITDLDTHPGMGDHNAVAYSQPSDARNLNGMSFSTGKVILKESNVILEPSETGFCQRTKKSQLMKTGTSSRKPWSLLGRRISLRRRYFLMESTLVDP